MKNTKSTMIIVGCIIGICAFTILGIEKGHLDFVLGLNWTVLIGMALFIIFLSLYQLSKSIADKDDKTNQKEVKK